MAAPSRKRGPLSRAICLADPAVSVTPLDRRASDVRCSKRPCWLVRSTDVGRGRRFCICRKSHDRQHGWAAIRLR